MKIMKMTKGQIVELLGDAIKERDIARQKLQILKDVAEGYVVSCTSYNEGEINVDKLDKAFDKLTQQLKRLK